MKEIAQYFDDSSLSEELIQQITLYLKDIYEAEGKFYREQKTRLRKEQDQIQQRLSKMYDDRYDGKIDESFFDRKLQEYKAREREVVQSGGKTAIIEFCISELGAEGQKAAHTLS